MGIITVLLLALAFAILSGVINGCIGLHRRVKEAREWRKIKQIYYPG